MNKSIKDLTGNVYDRLTVIGYSHSENGKTFWKCYCSCDSDKPEAERKIHIIRGKYLQDGSTSSCGCKKRDHINEVRQNAKVKSGKHKPLYTILKNVWRTLINRCHNNRYNRYKFHGEKNVLVCNLWKDDFDSFYEWAMSHNYSKGMELNRLDHEKNYSPDNCEWMPKGFSAGTTSNNILVTIGNKTQCLAAWSREEECEVDYATIRSRYHKGIRGMALIQKKKPMKDLTYKFRSKTLTFKEWSIETNIPFDTLRQRYARGDRGEKLFRKPENKVS